jgi:hypothetical protein
MSRIKGCVNMEVILKKHLYKLVVKRMRPEYNVPKWHYISALHNEHS